jgi:hypothetical protein
MTEKEECWSVNNEDFTYSELGELLDCNAELKVGDMVYVGDAVRPSVWRLCDANDVIDTIADRAFDIAGEHAEDCAEVSDEAVAELNTLLSTWIAKHCNLNFWEVKNVREVVLTAEHFPAEQSVETGDAA